MTSSGMARASAMYASLADRADWEEGAERGCASERRRRAGLAVPVGCARCERDVEGRCGVRDLGACRDR